LRLRSKKATPSVTVIGGSFVYDGEAHPAAGSVHGVNGESLGNPTFSYSYIDDNDNIVIIATAPVDPGYYTVTARFAGSDNYRNVSATATISIVYEVRLLTDLSRAFNAGRIIPIKIQLFDAFGHNLSSSSLTVAALSLTRVNLDGTRTQVPLQGSGNTGNLFRYDDTMKGYIFNLSTRGLSAGTYEFSWMIEGDPMERKLKIALI